MDTVNSFKHYLKKNTFKSPLLESKGRLDVSIQSANKYLSNSMKKEKFLNTLVEIRHKTDGLKINIIKKSNTGRAEEDYIVAYKNQIVYSNEYNFVSSALTKRNSINNIQLSFIWDHLIKLSKNTVPIGTEMFCEFLANKPTLSSDYNISHKLILIGYSKSEYQVRQGRLNTSPSSFDIRNRDKYAEEMKIDVPYLLFHGKLGTQKDLREGIICPKLKDLYRASDINWSDIDGTIAGLSEILLAVPSIYGGVEEGVVISYQDASGVILKFQQTFQNDQEARNKIKDQFRGAIEYENQYWKKVQAAAYDILEFNINKEMQDALTQVSKQLKTYKPDFSHEKKNKFQVVEDIQMTCRLILAKKLNSGSLVSGKYRVISKAHYNMIRESIARHQTTTVNIVSNKDTRGTKVLRNKMMRECFGDQIEMTNSSSGNLYTLMNKSNCEITEVIAGTDRVESYSKMLENNIGVNVKEIKRTDEDISASKIIGNIEDRDYFLENTPIQIHHMYEEIKKAYI